MRAKRAFTLTELLTVIAVMLVLLVATFGVLNVIAGRIGPEATAPVIQAMLNGARDYAVTHDVEFVRVVFHADTAKLEEGTHILLEYKRAGGGWEPVPNRQPVVLGQGIYVLPDMPVTGVTIPQQLRDVDAPGEADVERWLDFEKRVRGELASASPTGPFYVVFDPTGYMVSDGANDVEFALTIVQADYERTLAVDKVTAYTFFPLNPNTGTALVFE